MMVFVCTEKAWSFLNSSSMCHPLLSRIAPVPAAELCGICSPGPL